MSPYKSYSTHFFTSDEQSGQIVKVGDTFFPYFFVIVVDSYILFSAITAG